MLDGGFVVDELRRKGRLVYYSILLTLRRFLVRLLAFLFFVLFA
jgi:hypothetical protein